MKGENMEESKRIIVSPDFSFPYTLLRNEECEGVIKDGEEGGEVRTSKNWNSRKRRRKSRPIRRWRKVRRERKRKKRIRRWRKIRKRRNYSLGGGGKPGKRGGANPPGG